MAVTNENILNKLHDVELALELLSFAGGENTISEDHVCKADEARVVQNWDSISLGGMERSKGFNEVADGGATYTDQLDLLAHHQDAGGKALYGICEGDLVIQNSTAIDQEDAAAFTSGVISHAVSAGGKLWITNQSDGLKYKTVGVGIATPSSVPPTHCARIYNHKNRLIAEGSVSVPKRVYGTRTGTGNWTASDAWSLANDAYSIDLPDDTQGCVPDFPSGSDVLVFTERTAYAIYNFPNTAFRAIGTPARGCSAPYSIAKGDEGVYFLSKYPTLGVFLFDGASFYELTELNRDVFVEKIDLTKRIYGIYKDRKYRLFYNELNSGVSYPNRLRIYDARFKRWMEREINPSLSDSFGYPALLRYSNNELYVASSQKDKIYELDTADDSDEGLDTEAIYTTKNFSSRDFAVASGGQFPVDDIRFKLTKLTVTFYGTTGTLTFYWGADRGLHSGSKVIDLNADGDLINVNFIVNTSYITQIPPDKTKVYTFPNDAVGKRFYFQISNSGSSTRPKIKKIKVSAIAFPEP